MQSVHACAVQTHFLGFAFLLKKGFLELPILAHFGDLRHTFTYKGVPGVVVERSEKEVEKRGPPISYEGESTGGGVPIRDSSWDSSLALRIEIED